MVWAQGNLKTGQIVERGYLEAPDFEETPSLESNVYFEKTAAALRVIAQAYGYSEEDAHDISILLDEEHIHLRLPDSHANNDRFTKSLVHYSGDKAIATGHFSHLMFGCNTHDIKESAKDLADTVNLAIKTYGLENQVATAFDDLARQEAIHR